MCDAVTVVNVFNCFFARGRNFMCYLHYVFMLWMLCTRIFKEMRLLGRPVSLFGTGRLLSFHILIELIVSFICGKLNATDLDLWADTMYRWVLV